MLNLASARQVMTPTIEAPETTDEHTQAGPDHLQSVNDTHFCPSSAPCSPPLLFGPIWVREAQRVSAAAQTSPAQPIEAQAQADQPTSGIGFTPTLKDIFCQPPTDEVHRDSLRHAFLSLSSSF
jgi:hypothetical protein